MHRKERNELFPQGPQEMKMFDRPRQVRNYPTKLCAVCGGRFGLIRRYVCRTALCSNKCVNRFKARR